MGVTLGKSRGELARNAGVTPQFEHIAFAAPLSQIRPMSSDQAEPSLIQELTETHRAGALVLGVGIAV